LCYCRRLAYDGCITGPASRRGDLFPVRYANLSRFGASYLAPPDLFQQRKQKIDLLDVCTCSGFPTLAASCCLGRQPICCLEILSDGRLHSTLHMDLQTLSASSLRYRWGLHKQCCPMRRLWNPSPEHRSPAVKLAVRSALCICESEAWSGKRPWLSRTWGRVLCWFHGLLSVEGEETRRVPGKRRAY